MSRNTREQTVRKALARRMSLQFEQALTEAAGSLEALGTGWDDSGDRDDDRDSAAGGAGDETIGEGPGGDAAGDARMDPLPLDLQLADFERALGAILEQRDRVLFGYGEADREEANFNRGRADGPCEDGDPQADAEGVPNLDRGPAVKEAGGNGRITIPGPAREAAGNEAGVGAASSFLPTVEES